MQDKEFDDIFNSKFEDFEAEPSPMVWDNIADELDGKKSKGVALPWLSIAATIIVLLTAGVLFLRKDKPAAEDNKPTKFAAAHIKPEINKEDRQNTGPADHAKPSDKIAIAANHQPKKSSAVHRVTEPVTDKINNQENDAQQSKPDEQRLVAAIPDASTTNMKPLLPDAKLISKTVDMAAQAPAERPIVIASAGDEEPEPAKKHGIRSLGGLINVLIAKVDKRQDKLIEFSDSDDDDTESNVTGVNLGVIKIKKQ